MIGGQIHAQLVLLQRIIVAKPRFTMLWMNLAGTCRSASDGAPIRSAVLLARGRILDASDSPAEKVRSIRCDRRGTFVVYLPAAGGAVIANADGEELVRPSLEFQTLAITLLADCYQPYRAALEIGGTSMVYRLDARFEPELPWRD